MKWIFILGLITLVPLLSGWYRTNPALRPRVWMVLGFLPFAVAPYHLYVAPISWAMWPGYVKGVEVSLLDAIAVAIILATPKRDRHVNMKWPILLFVTTIVMSIFQSRIPMASFFYAWQMGRIFLLFGAVAIACKDDRAAPAIIKGLVIGVAIQAVVAAREYAGGALQTGGSFGHQNLLGMMTHFAVFPSLALLLAGRKGWAPILGPLAGLSIVVMTASRGTIGFEAVGIVVIFILSIMRRPTSRKTGIIFAALIIVGLTAPLVVDALQRRFAEKPLNADDERTRFENAALMMRRDHPLGVGANEYVVVANTEGYSQRANVVAMFGSRGANVHNAYLLSGAELGWPGMLAFIAMMTWPIVVALRAAWHNRRDWRGEILVGLATALIVVALHCKYEWIFVTFDVQYLFGIALGMVSGLASSVGHWKKRRSVRPRNDLNSGYAEQEKLPGFAA